jgi:hypothetical protein
MVSNTMQRTIQKTFEQKCKTCLSCDFYHLTMEEEDNFIDIDAVKGTL